MVTLSEYLQELLLFGNSKLFQIIISEENVPVAHTKLSQRFPQIGLKRLTVQCQQWPRDATT